ncbi:MAG: cation:proton antiporter [Promethearchaeota archaeon]
MEHYIILLLVLYGIGMTVGLFLQKYGKFPWMFTVVLTGLVFANIGVFTWIKVDPVFNSLSNMGQFCMLFIVGLSIDFKEFRRLAKKIFVGNFITCFIEGFTLSLLFYFLMPGQFSNSFVVCLLAGIGFATIGEVLLVAIITELKIEKTQFGQLTIGMGMADDLIEICILTLVSTLPFFYNPNSSVNAIDPLQVSLKWIMLAVTFIIILISTYLASKIGKKIQGHLMKLAKDYPFVNGFLFLAVFLGMITIGGMFIKDMSVIGAIFGGIIAQSLFPKKMAEKLKGSFKFLMMFIGPFFFFKVGYHISVAAIVANIVFVSIIIAVSIAGRVGSTMVFFKNTFKKKSVTFTFAIGLCVKFSTSVVILSILLDNAYITPVIYSVIMTAFLSEKIIVVLLYASGIKKILKDVQKEGDVCDFDDCLKPDMKLENIKIE